MKSDENLTEDLLKQENQIWYPDFMAIAIVAKKEMRAQKNIKIDTNVAILEYGKDHDDKEFYYDEFTVFLSLLKACISDKTNYRFQIALYQNGKQWQNRTHWSALDFNIENGKLTVIWIDGVDNINFSINKLIRKLFPTAIIYNLIFEKPPQRDGSSCSRFTLVYIYALQKAITLHHELDIIFLKNANFDRSITLEMLPQSLYNLLKPDQNVPIEDNFTETVLQKKIEETKQLKKNNDIDVTLYDHFKFYTGALGNKIHNKFIHYKKERYVSHVKVFLQSKNNEQIKKIIEHSKGGKILTDLNKALKEDNLKKDEYSFDSELILLFNNDLDGFIKFFVMKNVLINELKVHHVSLLDYLAENNLGTYLQFYFNLIQINDNPIDYKLLIQHVITKKYSNAMKILLERYPDHVLEVLKIFTIPVVNEFFSNVYSIKISDDSLNMLHLMVMFDNDKMISKILHSEQISIHSYNDDGNTPLHLAIKNNAINSFLKLLLLGADLNIKNKKSETSFAIIQNRDMLQALEVHQKLIKTQEICEKFVLQEIQKCKPNSFIPFFNKAMKEDALLLKEIVSMRNKILNLNKIQSSTVTETSRQVVNILNNASLFLMGFIPFTSYLEAIEANPFGKKDSTLKSILISMEKLIKGHEHKKDTTTTIQLFLEKAEKIKLIKDENLGKFISCDCTTLNTIKYSNKN